MIFMVRVRTHVHARFSFAGKSSFYNVPGFAPATVVSVHMISVEIRGNLTIRYSRQIRDFSKGKRKE